MMLPLGGVPHITDDILENDRRRTSQAYPGGINRKFWELMQSPNTKNGLLSHQIIITNYNYTSR